jgi:GAF domain-containing protein
MHVHLKHLEWERRAGDFRRAEHVNALLDIFADIGADIGLDAVVQRACEKIMTLCGALHCSIFIRDQDTGKFERRASSPLPEGAFLNKKYYEPGEGLTGWVARHGLPLNLRTRRDRDLEQIRPHVDWKNKEKEQHKELIDRPFVGVPIKLHGTTLGVIRCTDKRGERAVFTEADEQILLLIAAHIASAIAFEQRYEGEIKLLKNITSVLDEVKDRYQTPEADKFQNSLLSQVVDAARSVFRADVAIIYPFRHGALRAPIRSGSLQYEEYFGADLDNRSAVFQMLSARDEVTYYPDALDEPSLTSEPKSLLGRIATGRFVIREDICSSAAIKLHTAGAVRGILFLNYRGNRKVFSPQFKELLSAFTDIASVCVELSELHRDSVEIAEQLQNAVIPELVRDVIVDAGIGNRRLRQNNYKEAQDYLYAIESSAQRTAAILSDIVRRMIGRLAWAHERT